MQQDKLNIDKLLSGYLVPGARSKSEAFQLLASKMETKQKARNPKKPNRRIIYWSGSIAAAAVIVIIFLFNALQTDKELTNTQLSAQENQLPDQSTVLLKINTSLKYKRGLISGTRHVEMRGEAFFEVTKGKTFMVDFPGGKLQVLGTKFNIRSYADDYGRIDCYEGSVKLAVHDKSVILTKGQAIQYTPNSVEGPFDFDIQKAMKISDETYQWTNRPLAEILTFICDRAGYELVASPEVLNLHFTGTLNLTNNKIALTILGKAMHFKYELKGKKLIILETAN